MSERPPILMVEQTFLSLTMWGSTISMQVRDDTVVLHVLDDAPRSTETFHPVMMPHDDARKIRDLLNMATARGML